MGGMCLGSLLLPRFVSPERHPLRVYAALEAGIGVLGLVVLVAVPLVGGVYTATAAHGFAGILLRGLVCAICLLPPTLLMGATLPAIARWVEATPTGVSWLGFFYGSNIAGAVFGCLLAGFYLLRVHDMATTTLVAVAINFGVAAAGFALSRRAPHRPAVPRRSATAMRDAPPSPGTNAVYVAIALSGLAALGAEVVWTRLLSLMLGASVYTFSIILAVFLDRPRVRQQRRLVPGARSGVPRVALGWTQLLVAGGVAWAAWMIARLAALLAAQSDAVAESVDHVPGRPDARDRARCFPRRSSGARAFRSRSPRSSDPGRTPGALVGRVYAANTVGAIAGSVLFSVLVIPDVRHAARRAAADRDRDRVGGRGVRVAATRRRSTRPRRSASATDAGDRRRWRVAGVVAAFAIAVLLGVTVPKVPDGLVAYGRFLPTYTTEPKYLYVGEGMNSSIAVSEMTNGVRNFHVAGKVEASSEPQDMRLQRMLGHISALLDRDPQVGARRRLRRRRHGRIVRAASGHQADRDLRDRAADPEGRRRRTSRSENYNVVNDPRVRDRVRRRAALHSHDARRSSTSSRPTRSTRG